jgi:hypothetical protein
VDWAGWITFGFPATLALTGLMVFAQMLGLTRMDLPFILGTMFTEEPDRARLIGFVVHLVNGQIFALFYASAFSLIGRATWWLGLLFGLAHGMAALMILVPFAATVHPRMATPRFGPEMRPVLQPPGLLMTNYGSRTPLVALTAHAAFGVILGAFLSP